MKAKDIIAMSDQTSKLSKIIVLGGIYMYVQFEIDGLYQGSPNYSPQPHPAREQILTVSHGKSNNMCNISLQHF